MCAVRSEAREKRARLDSLVHYDSAVASLSIALGHDVSRFDSARERIVELARRENLTVRQLAQRVGGYSGLAFVGTPNTIADQMEEWLLTEASDGFSLGDAVMVVLRNQRLLLGATLLRRPITK